MGRTLDVMGRIWESRGWVVSGRNLSRVPETRRYESDLRNTGSGSFSRCNLALGWHTRRYESDLGIIGMRRFLDVT